MRAIVVALVLLLCGGMVWAEETGYAYAGSGCLSPSKHGSWMALIRDDADALADLTIPGTHDSGSFLYESLLFKTQCSTILEQLEAGIRFLDLRLAFIDRKLVLIHVTTLIRDQSPLVDDVLGEISAFLQANPSEVVFVRLKREAGSTNPQAHDYWDEEIVNRTFANYSTFIDTNCMARYCPLGASRGKMVCIHWDTHFPFLPGIPDAEAYPFAQDNFAITQLQTYAKWTKVRTLLTFAASTPGRPRAGVVNYLSASTGAAPYFFASGFAQPTGGGYLWTGLSISCTLGLNNRVFPDFPRGLCTCAGNADRSICAIHYKGMNGMLYTWLDNGLRGVAQSKEVEYVFPRLLGTLVLDFPNNALIDRIIDVNYAIYRGDPATTLLPQTCGVRCSCIAGDTNITTLFDGVMPARRVRAGDLVPRAAEDTSSDTQWCTVLSVNKISDSGIANGEFTADHFVVTNGSRVAPAGVVGGEERVVDLVNIATDCPAARTVSGIGFTPLSSVFCRDALSWSEYTRLYTALLRIIGRTGTFWFDPSIYVEEPSYSKQVQTASAALAALSSLRGGSEEGDEEGLAAPSSSMSTLLHQDDWDTDVDSLNVTLGESDGGPSTPSSWVSELPPICRSMAACAANGSSCDDFETLAARWIELHLPADKYATVKEAYPNMGDASADRGTLSLDVRGAAEGGASATNIVAIVVPAVVVGVVALIGLTIGVVCMLRKCQRSGAASTKQKPPLTWSIPQDTARDDTPPAAVNPLVEAPSVSTGAGDTLCHSTASAGVAREREDGAQQ